MSVYPNIRGEDVPRDVDGFEALDSNSLAAVLTRDGMIKHDGKLRAVYIRLQIAMSRVNQCASAPEYDAFVNVQGNASISIEQRRAAIVDTCRAELQRRGIALPNLDGLRSPPGNGNGQAPPQTS